MSRFSFPRFILLLRYDLLSNWRKHVRSLVVSYVMCTFLLGLVFYYPSRHGLGNYMGCEDLAEFSLINRGAAMMWFAFFLMSLYSVSQTFSHLYTKQQRIAWLMLPATKLEKFLSRIVVYNLLWPVCIVVSVVAADLTRMLFFPMLGYSFPSVLPFMAEKCGDVVKDILRAWNDNPENSANVLLGFFLYYVIYLLGSAFFRRFAMVKTTFVLGWGIGVLLIIFDYEVTFYPFVNLLAVVGGLWLTWRLMARLQVIPRKTMWQRFIRMKKHV